MKRKFMMVAALAGVLSLGACVEDNESQSVTDVREAKAAQLEALAAQAKAQGEAALINAQAEKAYKEAWAVYYAAQAAHQGALTEQVLQEIEQSRQMFAAQIEAIKAEYEARIIEAQRRAAEAEQAMLEQVEQRLQILYSVYFSELSRLNDLNTNKVNEEYFLAQYKSQLETADKNIALQTAEYQLQIDDMKAEIAAWETYEGKDRGELEKQLEALNMKKYAAREVYTEKQVARNEAQNAMWEKLNTYNLGYADVAASIEPLKEYNGYYQRRFDNYDDAWNFIRESVNAGLNDGVYYYNDGEQEYHYVRYNQNVYINGTRYYVQVLREEYVSLSEEPYIALSKYYTPEAVVVAMDEYYVNGKEGTMEYLGSPASDDKLATGLYLTKERVDEILAEAKEALPKAQTAFDESEKAYKVASDAKDEAQAAVKTAEESYNAAVKAQQEAQAAYDKAIAEGKDGAAEKAVLDKAIETTNAAVEALNKAYEANNKAVNAYYEARNAYYTAKNELANAKSAVVNAELEVAKINDAIASEKKYLENFDKDAAKWAAAKAVLTGETYAAEFEALKTDELVVAYVEAYAAYEEAREANNEANDAVNVVSQLLSSTQDVAGIISNLEKNIAQVEIWIAELKSMYGAADCERMIAFTESRIKALEEEIKVQQTIVDAAKARLEAAISAQ